MKPVLAWVKTNLVSVILLGVAVIALPVGVFVSGSMRAKTLKSVEGDIAKQLSDLNSVRVSYAVEPLLPTGKSFSASMPPNEATNEAIRALLTKQSEQAETIKKSVLEFNRAGHEPLVEGLLPAPASQFDEQPLADQFVKKWVPAHEAMLDEAGARMPPTTEEVRKRLEDVRYAEEQRIMSGRAAAELTDEDKAAITQRLTSERLQLYASRALQTRFYADVSVFDGVEAWKESKPPSLPEVWEMQWREWVHSDIVRALVRANSDDRSVLRGPVKRVERITVHPMAETSSVQGPFTDVTAAIAVEPGKSLTGRVAWPDAPNALYDLRVADVTLLVDAARIPAVVNAFSATNLMSVVGAHVDGNVDTHADLQSGFAYSREEERIVRLRLKIESLWLREWLAAYVPTSVKSVMGYPDAPPPEVTPEASGVEEQQAPPPPSRGGQNAADMGDIGKEERGGGKRGRRGGQDQ
ncbi:MAG: hypothetical protein AB7G17_08120 [Phycisphaerales bacterium]